MSGQARRKELVARYKQARPEAGVYCIVNSRNHRCLMGSAPNLASVRNRLEFAKSTNSPGALDPRLSKDIREFGIDSFSVEVLEALVPGPEMTSAEILEDLATLEALWREKIDPDLLY